MSKIGKLLEKRIYEGASTAGGIFVGTEKELKAMFLKRQAEDKKYYGENPYSGGWNNFKGIDIRSNKLFDKVFDTEEEAFEYIYNNTEKWGNLMAVMLNPNSPDIVKKSNSKKEVWVWGGWLAE